MNRLKQEQVDATASKFRSVNGLSESQPIDFRTLLLKLNVLTLFRTLSDNFSGMCLKDRTGNKFMLINSNNIVSRQRFTIAHELYHLFEEEDFEPHICNPVVDSKTPSEKNADSFAASLLMPNAGIWDFITHEERKLNSVSIATVLKIEHYFSVSRSSLLFRLKTIGLINEDYRKKLEEYPRADTAKRYGYDTALYFPENEGLIIGDYIEKARLLFEEEKISESHYIELLNKISDDGGSGAEED